jgi:hypothetical protein
MKSVLPFAFAAHLHADAVRDAYRNPPKPAEPEVASEPVRRQRLLRTLHLGRSAC